MRRSRDALQGGVERVGFPLGVPRGEVIDHGLGRSSAEVRRCVGDELATVDCREILRERRWTADGVDDPRCVATQLEPWLFYAVCGRNWCRRLAGDGGLTERRE